MTRRPLGTASGLSVGAGASEVDISRRYGPCWRDVRFLITMTLRLLAPAPGGGAGSVVAFITLFAAGAALACKFLLETSTGLFAPMMAVLTALAALAVVPLPRRLAPLRGVAVALLIFVHLFWLYQAAALAAMVGWAVSPAVWTLDGALATIAIAGVALPRTRVRVPLALPLGIAIAALLAGWRREDGLIRCDEYMRVRRSSVVVVVPSAPELERCVPGESVKLRRYPRRAWESPDGNRFLVTTQPGRNEDGRSPRAVGDWFDGPVCEVNIKSGARPVCFGEQGKGEALVESPVLDRIYVAVYGRHEGWVYVLPREGPLRPLAEAHVPAATGEMYVDEERDTIGLFADEAVEVLRVRASNLSPLDPAPAAIAPDEVHYDQQSHQGIACFAAGPFRRIDGQAFAAVAFDGDPFVWRPLAPSSEYPSSWLAGTWGCAWDPAARRAYVAVGTLGLLEQIDYDTGRIVHRSFVGFGLRSLAFDPRRRRVYASVFLNGDVIAVDADTGAIVDRWFVGRFARYVKLGRDGNSLLATSNVGVVRIPLPVEG
jgi:DNA-binding beta-propeller fold protein YncE